MLLAMLEEPTKFMDHIRRYTMSTVTQMAFGFRTTSIEDPRFQEAFEVCLQSLTVIMKYVEGGRSMC